MDRISGSALLDGVQLLCIRDLQNRWSMAIWPGKPSTRTYQVFANKWSAPELSSKSRLPGWASSYHGLQMDSTEKREKQREGEGEGGRWWEWEWARNGEGRCWITCRDAQSLVSLYHTNATWAEVLISLSQIWALVVGNLHSDEKCAICCIFYVSFTIYISKYDSYHLYWAAEWLAIPSLLVAKSLSVKSP